jgi:hypothetical protein
MSKEIRAISVGCEDDGLNQCELVQTEEESAPLAAARGERLMDTGEHEERWPLKGGRISTFRILMEQAHEDAGEWQDLVADLGETAWEASGARDRVWAAVDALLEQLESRAGRKLSDDFRDLSDDLVGARIETVSYGVMLGYALARTYPGSLEEWDGWVENAIAYAGIRNYPEIDQAASGEEDLADVQRTARQTG